MNPMLALMGMSGMTSGMGLGMGGIIAGCYGMYGMNPMYTGMVCTSRYT
jgi:hypothetical protein